MNKKMLLRFLIITGLLLPVLATTNTGAFSASSCLTTPNSANCDGKDPYATGCAADAANLGDPVSYKSMKIYLRYSPACRSAWARVDWFGLTPPVPTVKACVYRKVLTTNSPQCQTEASTNVFTNMLYLGRNTYYGKATGSVNGGTPSTMGWRLGY